MIRQLLCDRRDLKSHSYFEFQWTVGRRCFVQEKKMVYVLVHHQHSDSEEALHV